MPPPDRSFSQKAIRGVLWSGAGQYLLFAAGLVKAVILARLVDRELFGLVAGATAWTSFLTITRLDLRVAALNSREEPAVLDTQFLLENLSTALSFPIAVALMLAWPGLIAAGGWALIFLMLGAAQFEALTSTSAYLVDRRMRQDVVGRLTVVSAFAGPAISVGLALGGRPWAALALDAVWPALIPRLGAALFVGWRPRLRWDAGELRAQLRLAWTLWGTGVLGKITFQFDDWLVFNARHPSPVVWRATGTSAEAVYDRAYSVSKLPMDLAAGMIAANALAIYAERASHGRERLASAYRRMTWLLAWIIFASSAYLFAAADELVLVLGRQWVPMVPLLRLTVLFTAGRPLLQNCAQVLLALRRERDVRFVFMIQAVFLVVVCPPAVLYQGAAGAAVAVSVMSVVGLIIAERAVARELGAASWAVYVVPFAAAAVAVTAALLTGQVVRLGVWQLAVMKAFVCGAIVAVAIALFDRTMALTVWRDFRRGWRSA